MIKMPCSLAYSLEMVHLLPIQQIFKRFYLNWNVWKKHNLSENCLNYLFSAANGNYELCSQPHFRVSSTNTIFSYAANSIRYFESVVRNSLVKTIIKLNLFKFNNKNTRKRYKVAHHWHRFLSLLLFLNIFFNFFYCNYCCLCTGKSFPESMQKLLHQHIFVNYNLKTDILSMAT